MNADERWSCFVSIPKLAEEADCSVATCWRAISKADGLHILTDRGTRSTAHSRHDVTFITIHPNYKLSNLRPSETESSTKLSDMLEQGLKSEKTSSQICEENFLIRTPFKEPPGEQKDLIGNEGREERGVFVEAGSKPYRAWERLRIARGEGILPYQIAQIGGDIKYGRYFPSEWPPQTRHDAY
jgi:hypothetical protein